MNGTQKSKTSSYDTTHIIGVGSSYLCQVSLRFSTTTSMMKLKNKQFGKKCKNKFENFIM